MTSYKKAGIVLFMTNIHKYTYHTDKDTGEVKDELAYEVTYKTPPVKNQNDPSWYTETGHDWVCSVSDGEDTIHIYCDGILLIEDTKTLKQIKGLSDLYEAGVFNDEQLYKDSSSGKLNWLHNSWFDLYKEQYDEDEDEEWLDCVEYDLQEAIKVAIDTLKETMTTVTFTHITESD